VEWGPAILSGQSASGPAHTKKKNTKTKKKKKKNPNKKKTKTKKGLHHDREGAATCLYEI